MSEKVISSDGASLCEPCAVVGALIATMRLHQKQTERFVRLTGLHPTQHRMLMFLSRNAEPVRQRVLSEHFELTPAAVVQALDKLENDGYVLRETSNVDGRCKYIMLTEKGRRTAEESREAFREVDARLFANLSIERIDAFYQTLLQMQENLQETGEPRLSER